VVITVAVIALMAYMSITYKARKSTSPQIPDVELPREVESPNEAVPGMEGNQFPQSTAGGDIAQDQLPQQPDFSPWQGEASQGFIPFNPMQGSSPGTGPEFGGMPGGSMASPMGQGQAGFPQQLPFGGGPFAPGMGAMPSIPQGSGGPLPPLNGAGPSEDEFDVPSGQRFILPPIIGENLLNTVLGDKKFTLVYADRIDKDKQKKITNLHGNVRIQYKDNVIESAEAILNDDEQWARFFGEGGVFAKNDDGELRCDELETHFETKIAYVKGSVDIIRYANTEDELIALPADATRRQKVERALKKKQTHITCASGEYDWGKKIGDLHTNVHIEQVDKYADCDELHFERETESGSLKGNVVVHQDNGKWLFDEKVVTNEDRKVMRSIVNEKTTINCDELEFNGDKDWLQMRGNVYGVQRDKEGKCKTLTLDDSDEIKLLTLEDDVWLHQINGEWLIAGEIVDKDESDKVKEDVRKPATLTCKKLVVHTDTEDAEATGGVNMEQEHQKGKADVAYYVRQFDMIKLKGNVEVQREEKNTIFADEAILFMTTRVFEAYGNVRSTAFIDVEEERSKRKEEPEGKKTGEG